MICMSNSNRAVNLIIQSFNLKLFPAADRAQPQRRCTSRREGRRSSPGGTTRPLMSRLLCGRRTLSARSFRYHRRPFVGVSRPRSWGRFLVLGAILREIAVKSWQVCCKLTFEYPHEGPCVVPSRLFCARRILSACSFRYAYSYIYLFIYIYVYIYILYIYILHIYIYKYIYIYVYLYISGMPCIIVKQFREGLVFKAHRLVYYSTLGSRLIKTKKSMPWGVSENRVRTRLWH